jgi:ABC-2 type transport system ATP-binding protein
VTAVDVAKRWSATPALSGATFTVGDGVTGLLGANGAGKTTLLGLILGLHRPDSGSITVFGRDPWVAGAEVRMRLGYAPEHDALPPDVAAHDVVRHLAELHGLPRREATSRASDALWEVGLGEERFRPVGTMSTGQRQRVKLAQAIAHDPELLLLDEPTNGLDPSQREDMLVLIEHVGADLGMHVIVSSHLLEEVERVSTSVVILDGGRVVASGGIAELRQTTPELVVDLESQSGEPQSGGPQSGGPQSGEPQSGEPQSGERQSGEPQAGEPQAGEPRGGPDPAPRLVEALATAGLSATTDGPKRVRVVLESPDVYDTLRDALAAGGYSLRRLERRTASLEDIYLASSVTPVTGNGP